MRSLAISALLSLALAGCTRTEPTPAGEVAPTPAAAAKPAAAASPPTPAAAVAVATPTAAAPAAAPAEEGGACGKAEGEAGTCGGEAGKAEGAGCSQWDQAAAKVGGRPIPADAVWATIPVTGMTCGGCERRIIANLGGVAGILGVEADAELGQVRIAYAKGDDARPDDARKRIAALGYKPN